MGVTKSAIATLGNEKALSLFGQITNQCFVVFFVNLGPGGDFQGYISTLGTVTVAAHAMDAGLCLEMLLIPVINQRIEIVDGLGPDIAALAAIAAVGSAILNVFFAVKRYATGAAGTGFDIDFGLIEKFHIGHRVRRSAQDLVHARGKDHAPGYFRGKGHGATQALELEAITASRSGPLKLHDLYPKPPRWSQAIRTVVQSGNGSEQRGCRTPGNCALG